jgi:hypothetical protein
MTGLGLSRSSAALPRHPCPQLNPSAHFRVNVATSISNLATSATAYIALLHVIHSSPVKARWPGLKDSRTFDPETAEHTP